MSGSLFLSSLKALGYPGADTVDAQSFDWMFENEALLPFLDWFCDEVQSPNLLDPSDGNRFRQLEASEGGVLEGDQLEAALQNLSVFDDDDASEDTLKKEVNELNDELKGCRHRKDLLIQQRNKLNMHQVSVSDRLARMDGVENAAKLNYKMALEQSQADNSKMNGTLSALTGCVCELSALYAETTSGTDETQSPDHVVFLSQLDLSNYHKLEEKFTQELTAFTKKKFFEGISEMAGQAAGSHYEFLEISNPSPQLVKTEKERGNLDDCKELARLQAFYPKSQSQRVNALVEEKTIMAACDFVEQRLRANRDKPCAQDVRELSKNLQEAQTVLATVRRDLVLLSEEEVPHLIKDSAALQVTKILQGDYDLKITRQDYFISNQDQVISELVIQRARNEFLTMAYEIEAHNHRDTHRLLTAINMLLQDNYRALHNRLVMMKDSALSPTRHQRSTVDSRDKFIGSLHKILGAGGLEEKQQLFLTYENLNEGADTLHHHVTSLRASLSSTNSNQDTRLAVLESNLKALESVVYAGSSTGGQPVLCPQPILDHLTQLDSMLKKLEQAVMDIMKDVDLKKKALRNDPLQATERELFVYFFNDPDRLRRAVEEVTARLEAQLIK